MPIRALGAVALLIPLLASTSMGDPPTDAWQRLTVSGADLRYRMAGDGPPVVVLHGGPGLGSAYLEAPLTELLAPVARLVFYDQRASGGSGGGRPEDLHLDTWVRDLEALRSHLRLDRPTLLAHSFGALPAIAYAAAHPARVTALVLVDPDPPTLAGWSAHRPIVEARRTAAERERLAAITNEPGWSTDAERADRYFRTFLRPYFARPDDAARLELGLAEGPSLENAVGTQRAMRRALGAFDLRSEVRDVRHPVRIIVGGSSIFPRREHEALADAFDDGELIVIPASGHFPFLEAPGAFADAVRAFLAALPAAP